MTKLFCVAFILSAGIFLSNASLPAQADNNLRISVANMSQDISLLTQQVKALTLQVEALQRENSELKARLASLASDSNLQEQISLLADAMDTLQKEYQQADEGTKVQINQVTQQVQAQVEVLARETQAALNAMAKALNSAPAVELPVNFSEDYPRAGKSYVVRTGDTLSQIARDHGSTVKDIQNANKIANPARDLRVGQTIFIPIAE